MENQISQNEKPISKEEVKNVEVDNKQNQFEEELKIGAVSKNKKASIKEKVVKTKTKTKMYNDKGQLLTKKGLVDKRVEVGKKRYVEILEKKKAEEKIKPSIVFDPVVDSSDEEDCEFEIEIEKPLEAPIPVIAEKPSEPVINEQIKLRQKMDEDLIAKLNAENKKLKENLCFKQQLARIEGKARVMSCKWN